MPSGGARNRSGPQPDPNSMKSMKLGLTYRALPAEGFDGESPEWPLSEFMEGEREAWERAWRTPQAAAWIREEWRWPIVALWVRTFVRCQGEEATAGLLGALHRFADQIGMTPAGLKENGWRIAADEVSERREQRAESTAPSARDRMRALRDAASDA